jgi:hypothetical protein
VEDGEVRLQGKGLHHPRVQSSLFWSSLLGRMARSGSRASNAIQYIPPVRETVEPYNFPRGRSYLMYIERLFRSDDLQNLGKLAISPLLYL